eukprot:Em0001g2404a
MLFPSSTYLLLVALVATSIYATPGAAQGCFTPACRVIGCGVRPAQQGPGCPPYCACDRACSTPPYDCCNDYNPVCNSG